MIWATVKMILGLGSVILLLVFLSSALRRWGAGKSAAAGDCGIRLLTSKMIAPQKFVSVVEIAGEVLALGVSAQQVTFLTKIQNGESLKKHLAGSAFRPEPISWLKSLMSGRRSAGVGGAGEN
ncbi:MAG TPA: flagellar biosynthetic protein FliO [Thermodesulfobacteriota bacterium]|nr:flagellar biosynthetic protein FliO [Thermodesulfobacteriota bacterium]